MRYGVRKDYLKGSRRHHRGHSPYPFDRLLASRVGRAWDDVYSELCNEFDGRSFAGYRFREDLDWHVHRHCYIGVDGKVYTHHRGYPEEVIGDYYVHPWTGVLSYVPSRRWDRPEPEVFRMTLDGKPLWSEKNLPDVYLEKIDGIWYRFQITRRWTEKDLWGREYERTVKVRSQLGKKALRDHRLNNDSPVPKVRCTTCGFSGRCVHVIKAEAERRARQRGWW